jgi:predicted transcriptional regulator of viral defense system
LSIESAGVDTAQIINLIKQRKVIRASDVEEIRANRTMLPYLANKGILRRIARGAYALADYVPEHESFVEVATAVPHGVICLLSALQFHEITTQMPWETWLAIERGKRIPAASQNPLRIIKLSGDAFTEGIEEHRQDGVTIRVYSPAKTVADCFKFRNRIGLDVAREALIDTLASKKATRDEIWHYAQICRMARIMRPYLEMVK